MPNVLKVRYLGEQTASIPLAGREVEPDCVFDVPGMVVEHGPEDADDCVVVETGNPPQRVALPHSLFRVETPVRSKTTTDVKVEG